MGSTFDGLQRTNGYHPLWLMLMYGAFSGAHALGADSPQILLRIAVFVSVALFVLTAAIVARLMCDAFPQNRRAPALTAAASAAVILFLDGTVAMESCVTVLLVASYLLVRTSPAAPHAVAIPILLVLLFLARVDYLVSLVPALLAFEWWQHRRSGGVPALLRLVVPLLVVVAAYAYINVGVFGTPTPISSVTKSAFPSVRLFENLRELYDDLYHAGDPSFYTAFAAFRILAPIAVVPAFCWWTRRRSGAGLGRDLDAALLACGAGALMFIAAHLAFERDRMPMWTTTMPLFVSLLIVLRVAIVSARIGSRAAGVSLVAAAAFAVVADQYSMGTFGYRFAPEVRAATRPGDIIFQVNASGVTGFFSGRHVVNGDGLMNTLAYRQMLDRGEFAEYIRRRGITHVVSDEMTEVVVAGPAPRRVYREALLTEADAVAVECPARNVVRRRRFTNPGGWARTWFLCELSDPSGVLVRLGEKTRRP